MKKYGSRKMLSLKTIRIKGMPPLNLNKIYFSALFLCVVLFAGCGKFDRISNTGYTSVTFQRSSADQDPKSAIFNGGALIYAYSDSYVTNMYFPTETAFQNISLPNGVYTFYGIGYSQSVDTFSTDNDVRCAVTPPISLTGGSRNIVVNFRQADCSNGAFTGDGTFTDANSSNTAATASTVFSQAEVVFCGTAAGTQLSTISGTQNCSTVGGTGISAPLSSISKYKIILPIYARSGANFTRLAQGIETSCSNSYPDAGGGTAFSEYMRLPVGSTNKPGLFAVEIEAYTDGSCTSPPVVRTRFHNGLVFGPAPDGSALGRLISNGTTPARARIFLREL